MKFKSQMVTEASGSIGGITYSHNRGGMYTRSRATPTNPNTTYQQAVRGTVAQLTSLWLNLLTAGQREAWDTYAENVPLPDALGEPRNVGGLAMYVRSNVGRIQAALVRVDAAPTVFNLGDYTDPVIGVISAGGGTASIAFTVGDDWVGEDDAGMLLYASRGVNASINYFKGPYRFGDSIDGDGVTPETSPYSLTLPFTVALDQRCFLMARVSRADGRLSAPFRGFNVVSA